MPSSTVVIVSKQRIVGATNGSSAYLIELARSLTDAGCSVHLIQPSPAIAGRTPFIRLRPEMDLFARHKIRGAVRFGRLFLFTDPAIWRDAVLGIARRLARRLGGSWNWTRDRPRPYAVATPWSDADRAFVAASLPADLRAIIADYMFCAPAFDLAPPGTPRAIVMHDLFHSRQGAGADSVALVGRDEEIEMLSRAEIVIAIQAAEQAFVDEHVPGARGLLAPMPAKPVAAAMPGMDDRLLFVGSNTAPNSVGLRWFLDEVWPKVRAQRPDCQLDIAGSVDRAFDIRDFPGVRFHGMVGDLAPFYEQAGIVISPLTFGSGLKIKLIEGLAQGKAMVVSGITLQGVEETCEGSVIRADDPEDFAEGVAQLAGDRGRREQLAGKALECANAHFSAQSVHAALREWVAGL